MKKIALVLLVSVCLVSVAMALSDKYQIFSERKGLFGWGGRTILLLDRETGDTWRYATDKWVAIPKVSEEASDKTIVMEPTTNQAAELDRRAKLEAELDSLKAKQESDLKAFQVKQAEEIKSLINNASGSEPVKTEMKKERRVAIARPIRAAKPKSVSSIPKPAKTEENNEEGPPSWLTD